MLRNVGAVVMTTLLIFATTAESHWKPEYAELPQQVQDWYKSQTITPEARARILREYDHGWVGCCDNGDAVKTQYRVDLKSGKYGRDEWWYLKDGHWKKVPDDIIHWGEHAPDGQAVLFVHNDIELCFWPPREGE
jgi:hypothetical protein